MPTLLENQETAWVDKDNKSVRARRDQPRRAPAPVRVAGEPVSHTIIEERR